MTAALVTAPPTDDEAARFGLRLGRLHRHDSRPGSWCVLVGLPGAARLRWHLQYDPHATSDGHRTVYGRADGWIADTYHGNRAALALLAGKLETRPGVLPSAVVASGPLGYDRAAALAHCRATGDLGRLTPADAWRLAQTLRNLADVGVTEWPAACDTACQLMEWAVGPARPLADRALVEAW